MEREQFGKVIAEGIVETGIEGGFDSVSCSTAGDYPSIGVSQWEGLNGGRGDTLLSYIDGGDKFIGRTYSEIINAGEIQDIKDLLGSEQGQAAQLQILAMDCADNYADSLIGITAMNPNGDMLEFNDSRGIIYAGMWCPTSTYVVGLFIKNRIKRGYDVNNLSVLRDLFYDQYTDAAGVGEANRAGYQNRAQNTYDYVKNLNLSEYGVMGY